MSNPARSSNGRCTIAASARPWRSALACSRRLADTNVIVNAACPGYVATDFTGFAGDRTPEQGAQIAIRLATLPDDGPRGGCFDDRGPIPW